MALNKKSAGSSLREVAIRTGVSSATASRVLNNPNFKVLPETRERIERIASELRYRPNRTARSLATGCSQTIALCAPTLHSAYLKSEAVLACPDDPNTPVPTLPGIGSNIERSYTVFTQVLDPNRSSVGASLAQINLPSGTALASERAWCNFGSRSAANAYTT